MPLSVSHDQQQPHSNVEAINAWCSLQPLTTCWHTFLAVLHPQQHVYEIDRLVCCLLLLAQIAEFEVNYFNAEYSQAGSVLKASSSSSSPTHRKQLHACSVLFKLTAYTSAHIATCDGQQ